MAKRLIYILIAFLAVSGFAATQGTLIDKRDGKKYKTVKIGDQTWMAENLNYKADSSFCYNNKESNCAKYGRLYTWNAAKKACPAGWHLPSKVEFEMLINLVGGKSTAGKVLKSKKGWNSGGNGTDDFGFSAPPAGYRDYSGASEGEGDGVNFWSSTDSDSDLAYYMYLNFDCDTTNLDDFFKNFVFSVRCLKGDASEQIAESSSSVVMPMSSSVDVVSPAEVTVGSMTDSRDGQTYKTVKIGMQTWMAKNLNYEMPDSYCYKDSTGFCDKYGRLYRWNAAMKACPAGWYLPSKVEFEMLINLVGGKSTAGKVLKSKKGWDYSDNGTDDFGFSALPAGDRISKGHYFCVGSCTYFWSSTEDFEYAYYMYLDYSLYSILGSDRRTLANSVRCLKDSQ